MSKQKEPITGIEITFEALPKITVEVYRDGESDDARQFPNEECANRFIDRMMREARTRKPDARKKCPACGGSGKGGAVYPGTGAYRPPCKECGGTGKEPTKKARAK